MVGRTGGVAEERKGLAGADRAGIGVLRNDSNETVLGDWTRSPSGIRLRKEPRFGPCMVDVCGVQERKQHVYI